MPFIPPGTGAPDGEPRAMPHGDTIDTQTGQTATVGGLVLTNGGNGWHVAAYRSLVVVVINNGVNPINVTPRWSFWAASSSVYTEETQSVPALTHKRLLFQNEADFIQRITFTGVGGSSAFAYYITGSNLDPFPGSAYPALYLTGTPVQSYGSGVGFNYVFDQVGGAGNSHNTDSTIYEYNTVAPGQTDTIDVLQPGLYLVHAGFHYNLPAADSHWEFAIVPVNSDTYPSALPTQQSGTDKGSVFASSSVLWSVKAASVGFPQNQLQVSGIQTSGGLVAVDSGWLHIVRLTASPP